jgi:NAD(P)-dependent dehydrogenase (short-subunit alcohol dehydrogenase family)
MSNVGDVNGMVAVVTSGALGMGAAHVRALAREGAIVAATNSKSGSNLHAAAACMARY